MPEATEGPTVLRILLGTQLRRLRDGARIVAACRRLTLAGSRMVLAPPG